ncbi:MAG: tRNA (cytidine(34)-2'-O)-methyltransferase [Betaproteobacteria bacterium]|nr:MAG: tRNA (cytidine(34)-2'-O)-methyltransferase [Betaproteobacteria bacterium]
MFDVVLFQPEIPPNTGNIIRLCANSGCRLHLIEPLGFHMDARALRRAGLDYGEFAEVFRYRDWAHWRQSRPLQRAVAFTTKASRVYSEFRFQPRDALVFGPETRGLPAEILAEFDPGHRLKLPMVSQQRSLNLSNAVAVAVYEAWRQTGFRQDC